MKKVVLALAIVILTNSLIQSQYSNPNLDQIPADFWDAISPQSTFAVITDNSGYDNFNLGTDFGEPHISSNPLNPLNYFVAYNTNGTHYTLNGIDWFINNPSFGVSVNGDPVTAYDSIGNLYYENMYGGVTGTKIIKSTNNSQSWFTAVNGNTGNDKNWLAADQTNGPYKNYIYTVMTPGNFKRSTDGGATFVQTFTSTNTYPGMMVCVGPNGSISGGAVYVVTNTGSSAFAVTYNFYRSTNGGANFTLMSSQNFANYVGTNSAGRHSIENMRTRPYPMIAADNSYGIYRGRLYLAYAKNNPIGDGNKPDIYVRYSTNGGTNWSDTIRVNDNVNPMSSHQFFPAIWCDKTTGRLYCKWFDTRDTPTNDSMHVYASYSDNGGVTWAQNQRITTQKAKINCSTCGGGGTPRYQGDYDAVTSNSTTSMMAWTDMRAGTFGSYTAFFPDFAMKLSSTAFSIHQTNDSKNLFAIIPAVKLFTDQTQFSATVTPTPSSGSIAVEFPNSNLLYSYPDSVHMKIRTIGTVTTGNYTITVTAKGTNGTPVHMRTATLTVNSIAGPVICEDFSTLKFPPESMYEDFSGENYWLRKDISAYSAGSGSAKFDFYYAPSGTVQSLVSNNFNAVGANSYLTFDVAYSPNENEGPDTLLVEASSNFGNNFTTVKTLLGKTDGTGELNTAPVQTTEFVPDGSQWRPRIYFIPAGTNKIRITAKSGSGNNLYVDNLCVQTLTAPAANSVSVVPEGMWLDVFPNITLNDTIKVYLARTDFPNIRIDSATTIISNGATAMNLIFDNALSGTYYKIVNHRNTIETWSKSGGELYTRGSNLTFSFLTPANQAYGNNQKLVNPFPYYGMYSGDVDKNGIIDGTDALLLDNAAAEFTAGYVPEDLNGDNFVDGLDYAICDNNAVLGITIQSPPGAYEYDRSKFRTKSKITK